MITTRITFVLEQDGFAGWQLQELRQLCGYFNSIFVVYNVTRSCHAKLNEPLRMMTLGSCRDDVCQLAIEGLDSELACMVFTEYFREHTTLFSTSHKKNHFADQLFTTHDSFGVPFEYVWHSIENQHAVSKQECIELICNQIDKTHATVLLPQFLQRENIASTIIAPAIAAPHITSTIVEKVTITSVLLYEPIVWHCAFAPVKLIIGIVLPTNASRNEIVAVTRLTRWLISGKGNELLLNAKREETIKGILLHVMGHIGA